METKQSFVTFISASDPDVLAKVQGLVCGRMEEGIVDKHDARIGKAEQVFRKSARLTEADEASELAWDTLDRAILDMHREMAVMSFWAGIAFALSNLAAARPISQNGQVTEPLVIVRSLGEPRDEPHNR